MLQQHMMTLALLRSLIGHHFAYPHMHICLSSHSFHLQASAANVTVLFVAGLTAIMHFCLWGAEVRPLCSRLA